MKDSFWIITVTPPTPLQRLWATMFVALWHLVQVNERGAGKTWFWWHVVAYIEREDPDVRVKKSGLHGTPDKSE